MPKHWKTIRKIDPEPADGESSEPSAADENKVQSKLPRRRLMARQQALAASEPEPEPVFEPDPEPEVQPLESIEPTEAELAVEERQPPVFTPAAHPLDVAEPRILVVNSVSSPFRLIEETFEHFTDAKIDSTSDVLVAFELAMLRDYQLFVLGLSLPEMTGPFFYELVSRAYKTGLTSLGDKKLAPAVVYLREPDDLYNEEEISRDVRVKAVWPLPLNMERMLDSVSTVIRRK